MSVRYVIDRERAVIFQKATGRVTDAELRLLLEDQRRHPDYDPRLDVIADFRDADMTGVASETMYELVDLLRPDLPNFTGARWAIIVESDLNYGLARIFTNLAGLFPAKIEVFRSLDDAISWLAPLDPQKRELEELTRGWEASSST